MSRAKPPPIPSQATEAAREEHDTAFTPILRRLRESTPKLLAATFVDTEGECIDYASSIDPFEAKVAGAHMHMLVNQLCETHVKLGLDEPILLEIRADQRELWGRRVCEDYLLVAVLKPGADEESLKAALTTAGKAFREEVGIATPPWEPQTGIEVVVRSAVGWEYAPESYSDDGVRVTIADVIGRWNEPGALPDEETVCFRVRTADGREITLVHDPNADGWVVRP